MANKYTGIGILFGFPGGPTATLTGAATLAQLQSLDFSRKAQKEQVKDGTNNTAGVNYSDHEDNVNFEFYWSDGSNSTTATSTANFAAATCTAVPTPGETLAVTDSNFTPISKTFFVDEFTATRGNSKAMLAKITLSRYLNNSLPS